MNSMKFWLFQFSTQESLNPYPSITSSTLLTSTLQNDTSISKEVLSGIIVGSVVGLLLLSLAIVIVAWRCQYVIFSSSHDSSDAEHCSTDFDSVVRVDSPVASYDSTSTTVRNIMPMPTIIVEEVQDKPSLMIPADTAPSPEVSCIKMRPKSRDGWYRIQDLKTLDLKPRMGYDNPTFCHLQNPDRLEPAHSLSLSDVQLSPDDGSHLSEESREEEGVTRRSYRLDDLSASAIAAQLARESLNLDENLDCALNCSDIVVVYNERTML